MVSRPTVWFNPQCSKCRTAQGILVERGVDAEYVHYLTDAPSPDEIRRVLRLLGYEHAGQLARTGEPLWAELGLDEASDDDVLEALARHPVLIERPVVVVGDRAVVARPPERVLELLDDGAGPGVT